MEITKGNNFVRLEHNNQDVVLNVNYIQKIWIENYKEQFLLCIKSALGNTADQYNFELKTKEEAKELYEKLIDELL